MWCGDIWKSGFFSVYESALKRVKEEEVNSEKNFKPQKTDQFEAEPEICYLIWYDLR